MKKMEKGEKHSKRTQIIEVYRLNFDEALHEPESQEGFTADRTLCTLSQLTEQQKS